MIRLIRRPLLTEKNSSLNIANTYVFEVDKTSTKQDIRKAIEKLFSVHVIGIRTLVNHGKMKRVGMNFGRLTNIKKAFVRIKDGETIELVKGV